MRYFNLKNKNLALCSLNGNKLNYSFEQKGMTFPINEKRKLIETELLMRNYDVPGIDVEFCFHVDREGKYLYRISSIRCENPDLRIQSDYEIRVRGVIMSLHDDGSGSVDMYCGDDWEKDRKEFVNGKLFHRKMDNKSRINLHYQRSSRGQDYMATTDCSRGYYPDPERNEPERYSVHTIEQKIMEGLDDLLHLIKTTPRQKLNRNLLTQPDPTYLTNPIFTGTLLHTTITSDTADDIQQKTRGNYGIDGGWRLLDWSCKLPEEHPYRELMHDGFIYCEIEWPNGEITKNNWHYNWRNENAAILKLKNMDNVFVVDVAAGEKYRKEWFEQNPGIDTMTNEAYSELQIARGKTMIHINDYKGDFQQPLVIIGRIVEVEEIELLTENKNNASNNK